MRRLYMKKENSSKSDPVMTRAMRERSFYQRISTSLMGKGNDARDAQKSPDANMFQPGNPEAIPEQLIY